MDWELGHFLADKLDELQESKNKDSSKMIDILPKEKPVAATDETVSWYLEDMLLAYKYNFKDKFLRDINALRPFLSRQVILILLRISENKISWRKEV